MSRAIAKRSSWVDPGLGRERNSNVMWRPGAHGYPVFVGFLTAVTANVFEKKFHHSEPSSCVSRARDREAIELGRAREGAKWQCIVAVSN